MKVLSKMKTAKSVLSTVGSTMAAVMVTRSMLNEFLPLEVRDYLFSSVRSFISHRLSSSSDTIIIEELDGLESNQIFDAAQVYLGTLTTATSGLRFKVSKPESATSIRVTVDQNEEIIDHFNGVVFGWVLLNRREDSTSSVHNRRHRDMNSSVRSESRCFRLTFPTKAKSVAMDSYLTHILEKAQVQKEQDKSIKLFTMNMYAGLSELWNSTTLNHPATFQTRAIDTDLKQVIMEDLERFLRRKEYYRRVGKAWKRGYLLYGPPGTEKSSLIAAMANCLKFDVYDLDLSALGCDSGRRSLLLATSNRSILVVEDIDRSIELKDRNSTRALLHRGVRDSEVRKVTLSGVLNAIDGLWSSCGDERIIIFTTNHKEKLDPEFLRPVRMDMHIHMSFCSPLSFKILVNSYLGIDHHELFFDIEQLIDGNVNVTPADVAEQLIKHGHGSCVGGSA